MTKIGVSNGLTITVATHLMHQESIGFMVKEVIMMVLEHEEPLWTMGHFTILILVSIWPIEPKIAYLSTFTAALRVLWRCFIPSTLLKGETMADSQFPSKQRSRNSKL